MYVETFEANCVHRGKDNVKENASRAILQASLAQPFYQFIVGTSCKSIA